MISPNRKKAIVLPHIHGVTKYFLVNIKRKWGVPVFKNILLKLQPCETAITAYLKCKQLLLFVLHSTSRLSPRKCKLAVRRMRGMRSPVWR